MLSPILQTYEYAGDGMALRPSRISLSHEQSSVTTLANISFFFGGIVYFITFSMVEKGAS